MAADERLLQYLREGKDWERKTTNIPGVFLLKLPPFRGRPATLAIEINPVDSSGAVLKKRGIIIRSAPELDEINRLLSNPKIYQLAKSVDGVNPERKLTAAKSEGDIFEI
jgi:hypothetical protein